jgi:hypothetical protein
VSEAKSLLIPHNLQKLVQAALADADTTAAAIKRLAGTIRVTAEDDRSHALAQRRRGARRDFGKVQPDTIRLPDIL